MSAARRTPTLAVDADLRIDLDGRVATLVGDGRRLTFTSDAPQDLWASLKGAVVPVGPVVGARAVGRFAEALATQDLELHLVGPDGEIAHLGFGAHSWWGRAATGSALIEIGSFRSVRVVLGSVVRRSRLFWPATSALGAAAGSAVVLVARRGWRGRRR